MDTNAMKQENVVAGMKYTKMVLAGLDGIDSVLDGLGADKKYNNAQIAFYKELQDLFKESLLSLV